LGPFFGKFLLRSLFRSFQVFRRLHLCFSLKSCPQPGRPQLPSSYFPGTPSPPSSSPNPRSPLGRDVVEYRSSRFFHPRVLCLSSFRLQCVPPAAPGSPSFGLSGVSGLVAILAFPRTWLAGLPFSYALEFLAGRWRRGHSFSLPSCRPSGIEPFFQIDLPSDPARALFFFSVGASSSPRPITLPSFN